MTVDRTLIDRYLAGASAPAEAIRGLTAADLDAPPASGGWTIRQIVLHLADSDVVGSDRMKRVAAEPNPTLLAYDENAWAKELRYEARDAALAAELFRVNRLYTAAILRDLPDAAFARTGNHTERGLESLADLVRDYAGHLDHHMKFLNAKRAALGK